MNQALATIEKHFADADAQLQKAKHDLSLNKSPDLTGLDTIVSEACDLVKTLSAAEREKVKNQMISLMDDITLLTHELRKQQDDLQTALKGNKTHSQATIAYRKPTLS